MRLSEQEARRLSRLATEETQQTVTGKELFQADSLSEQGARRLKPTGKKAAKV